MQLKKRDRQLPHHRRSFADFVYREYFVGPVEIVTAFTGLLGAAGIFIGATDVWRAATERMSGVEEFRAYLLITYVATLALASAWWVVYRTASWRLYEVTQLGNQMAKIQHLMAETVRCYAVGQRTDEGIDALDKDRMLRDVLGTGLRAYLQDRIGRNDVSVTVKYFQADEQGGDQPVLRTVFRALADNTSKAPRAGIMVLGKSVVLRRFLKCSRTLRLVMIPDTQQLPTEEATAGDVEVARQNKAYREYAEQCAFRSVLAFPIREPISLQPSVQSEAIDMQSNGIRGFFSLDCPEPGAFDRFFLRAARNAAMDEAEAVEPEPDIEFLYGLADCLATIAMLQDRPVESPMHSLGHGG